jgi:hypothetical protein
MKNVLQPLAYVGTIGLIYFQIQYLLTSPKSYPGYDPAAYEAGAYGEVTGYQFIHMDIVIAAVVTIIVLFATIKYKRSRKARVTAALFESQVQRLNKLPMRRVNQYV